LAVEDQIRDEEANEEDKEGELELEESLRVCLPLEINDGLKALDIEVGDVLFAIDC
jgi:hypothetical protein